jgi:hypothetical protein
MGISQAIREPEPSRDRMAAMAAGVPPGNRNGKLQLLVDANNPQVCQFHSLNATQRKKILRYRDAIEQVFESCIRAGCDEGSFRVENVGLTRVAIVSLCVSVLNWFSPRRQADARAGRRLLCRFGAIDDARRRLAQACRPRASRGQTPSTTVRLTAGSKYKSLNALDLTGRMKEIAVRPERSPSIQSRGACLRALA